MLLTAPTSHAHYKPEDISSSARSLVTTSLSFWQDDQHPAEDGDRMAQPHQQIRPRSNSRPDDTELWFSMPSAAPRSPQRNTLRPPEPSAFQATSSRRAARSPDPPSPFPSIPLISTTPEGLNKPLPPSPESEKKRRKPASLRNLIRRRPSDQQLDPSHLQPQPYQHQRSSSAGGHLSPEPLQYSYHQSSHSMPVSPAEFSQLSPPAESLARAHSAAANYAQPGDFSPYDEPSLHQNQQQLQPPPLQHRAVSMNTYFEPQPFQTRRTFPESGSPSVANPRDSYASRPRPHTWLSPRDPNEPFRNDDDFHLFVEATSGFQDGSMDFGNSATSPPPLQGSLFGRGRQNDRIPLPFQNPIASQPSQPDRWQSQASHAPRAPRENVRVSSSALPRVDSYDSYDPFHSSQPSPGMNAINMELERLGVSDDGEPDDELPNYAQSQAEMASRKRKEATDRARELEARWNSSRGWRSR